VQQTIVLLYAIILWTSFFAFLSVILKNRDFKIGFVKIRFVIGGFLLYIGKEVKARQSEELKLREIIRFSCIAATLLGMAFFYAFFIPSLFNMIKGFIAFSAGMSSSPPQPIAVPIPLLFTVVSVVKYLIISIAIGAAVHEFAHAIIALREGVGIRNWGVGCIFLIPLAFVELDDNSFKNASSVSRASIAAAGPFANALTALAAWLLILFILSSGFALSTAVEVVRVDCSICSVAPCPAAKAGLYGGDVIYAVNGTIVQGVNDIAVILNKSKLGDVLILTVCRGGVCFDKNVVLDAYSIKYGLARPCLGVEMRDTTIVLQNGKPYGGSIVWELMQYLTFIFAVNFSLFVFNAIPLYITDGTVFLSSLATGKRFIGKVIEAKVLDKVNVAILIIAIAISTYLFLGV
jgi:membrane-associated protease RseP (regulator of RpoE activity)